MNNKQLNRVNELLPELKQLERLFSYRKNRHERMSIIMQKHLRFFIYDGTEKARLTSRYVFDAIEKQIRDIMSELEGLGYTYEGIFDSKRQLRWAVTARGVFLCPCCPECYGYTHMSNYCPSCGTRLLPPIDSEEATTGG